MILIKGEHNMEIISVGEHNLNVYLNLAQSYEGEFSGITRKKPNECGLFPLDTQISDNTKGYLLIIDNTPAGLAAILAKSNNKYEVSEFYIIPYFRKQLFGKHFAHQLWRMFPGHWEVKQITGADDASVFWRKVISEFTLGTFLEDKYEDSYWGLVTRQQFCTVIE
jgi:predicted acetyltransferase